MERKPTGSGLIGQTGNKPGGSLAGLSPREVGLIVWGAISLALVVLGTANILANGPF